MGSVRESRLYVRRRGGRPRMYGDFRDFADVGGGQEALIPPGARAATDDADIARVLIAERVKDLELRRRSKILLGVERETTLVEYVPRHLRKKANGSISDQWLEAAENHLKAAIQFFCNQGNPLEEDDEGRLVTDKLSSRSPMSISVDEVEDFVSWLAERPNGKGLRCPECNQKGAERKDLNHLHRFCEKCDKKWRIGTLAESSQRKYLNSLSNLYRRLASKKYVLAGYNPVAALLEKPSGHTPGESDWLEVHVAALLLEAARLYVPDRSQDISFGYPLLATYLLTGCRRNEVLGLMVDEVSLSRSVIRIKPNKWRGIKTLESRRSVQIWPQLEEILSDHLRRREGAGECLVFPSPRTGEMLTDLRPLLNRLTGLCGWKKKVTPNIFRHTYCAARLQTLDNGAPVAKFTVGKELGHGGHTLVERIYGHLGQVRHRSPYPEFRAEQHAERLEPSLTRLRKQFNAQ